MESDAELPGAKTPEGVESEKPYGKQRDTHRKSSFSEAINKFTTTHFNRRRTTTFTPSSTSANHPSHLPTPSGIPRSTSFFSNFNTFAPEAPVSDQENDISDPQQVNPRRPRRISDRLAQTPFFTHFDQPGPANEPAIPSNKRHSGVTIEQRGLMKPVQPPLPKSSTTGCLPNSPYSLATPRYMRPTSSSAARRESNLASKNQNTSSPLSSTGTGTSTSTGKSSLSNRQQTPTASSYPQRKTSLLSRSPALPPETPSSQETTTAAKTPAPSPIPIQNVIPIYNVNEDRSFFRRSHCAQDADEESVMAPSTTDDEMEPILRKFHMNIDTESAAQDQEEEPRAYAPSSGDERPPNGLAAHPPNIDYSDPRLVHEAQPPTYWLGRFTSLSDQFRTGALALPPPPPSAPDTTSSSSSPATPANDPHHPMHDAATRSSRVFVHMRGLCTTEEARTSLRIFEGLMEERERREREGGGGKVRGKGKKGWLGGLMGGKGRRRRS